MNCGGDPIQLSNESESILGGGGACDKFRLRQSSAPIFTPHRQTVANKNGTLIIGLIRAQDMCVPLLFTTILTPRIVSLDHNWEALSAPFDLVQKLDNSVVDER